MSFVGIGVFVTVIVGFGLFDFIRREINRRRVDTMPPSDMFESGMRLALEMQQRSNEAFYKSMPKLGDLVAMRKGEHAGLILGRLQAFAPRENGEHGYVYIGPSPTQTTHYLLHRLLIRVPEKNS